MAITNFIPTVWSETLYRELEKEYIGVKNCSREFEGDIKNMGDTVRILGVNPISVFNYTKNTDIETLTEVSDNSRTLTIDKAKAFNFIIDDIALAQAAPNLMQEAMRVAASALSNEADKYIYSLYTGITDSNTIQEAGLKSSDMLDFLLAAQEKMLERNVPGNEEIILEVSPAVASRILKAKILTGTSNEQSLDKGCIGTFLGFKIYVSTNVQRSTENGTTYFQCFARTKRAIPWSPSTVIP